MVIEAARRGEGRAAGAERQSQRFFRPGFADTAGYRDDLCGAAGAGEDAERRETGERVADPQQWQPRRAAGDFAVDHCGGGAALKRRCDKIVSHHGWARAAR